MIDELLQRFGKRDRKALSRLITISSRANHLDAIRAALNKHPKHGHVVAITGSAGVGKSSLIGKMVETLHARGSSVAVLACDPQSPITGGALLGDRIRMHASSNFDNVFIRSLAVPSGHQAVAENLDVIIEITKAFGFDLILLETVGAGQGDTAIRDLADKVVVLVQPESGDELQWEKAGLLEIADIVVVHKSDLPHAEQVEADLRELLNLPGCREIPVMRVSSNDNSGLRELCNMISFDDTSN